MRTSVIAFIAIALLLAACTPQEGASGNVVRNTTNETAAPNATQANTTETTPTAPKAPPRENAKPEPGQRYLIERTEGDLIELKPQAIDPDGDKLSYTFTKPFDAQGRWQTAIGDEGRYAVVIGVSDGLSQTTETVDVVVRRANRPPVINCRDVVVREGEGIDLHDRCVITDEDDSEVVVTYSGWMGSWRYDTTFDDAGTHTVTITASDKRAGNTLHTVERNVTVTVEDVDRAPEFDETFPVTVSATENDVITLPRDLVRDPDGDDVTFTFSPPFDSRGQWKTKIGDAGAYDVDIVASDGKTSAKRTVKVELKMLNTAPVLKHIPDVTVREGETIRLPINAYDREGDRLTTTVSGWMTGDTYRTTFDDAGNYTVKVTVSDGVFNATQVVPVHVADVNRPPVFVSPA